MSKLELIIGPMCSGKSSELIKRIRLFNVINKKVLVIKPYIDNRYAENKIVSHNQESYDCIVLKILDELENINNYNVIIIDEGQFFNDLKKTVINWLDQYNLNIIVAFSNIILHLLQTIKTFL
jgi:thymidine kinase